MSCGKVRLVALSMASSVTGDVCPVEQVTAEAHRHGAKVMLDAAQTVGVIPIDVQGMNIDMLAFGGHKGTLGPHGIGGFYAHSTVEFEHAATGADFVEGGGLHSYCDVGSVPYAALAGMEAGIEHLLSQQHGIKGVALHCQALAKEFAQMLTDLDCVVLHGGADFSKRTGAVSLSLQNGSTPAELGAWLAADGIVINASTQCASMAHGAVGTLQDGGTARVSFGFQSTHAHVHMVAASIRRFLQVGSSKL